MPRQTHVFFDGQYTVFGQMTDGFEALDAIKRGDAMTKVTVSSRNPNGLSASDILVIGPNAHRLKVVELALFFLDPL